MPVGRQGTLSLYSRLDGQLSRTTKFCLLVAGLFLFFGMHNFLQEKIMHFPGFKFGFFLGFLEVSHHHHYHHHHRHGGRQARPQTLSDAQAGPGREAGGARADARSLAGWW